MKIAAFLDRDGTLNVEKGYIDNLDNLELIPGAAQAVRRLNDAGILAILTTNQTGAARGYYNEEHILALNAKVQSLLKEQAGAWLDAVFYCPHYDKGTVAPYNIDCDCRKPACGMIEAACKQFPDIDKSRSFVLGDKATDVEFGHQAGCKSILLKTGYGERVLSGEYQTLERQPDYVCDSIVEAIDCIMQVASAARS